MSINVTVTGNPVNIKRGKMVCYDRNNQKEFEKRRLMRLEQVRQQSKEIAEDVRRKVRKEKTKQLSKVEKEGEEKLKKWQARKLSELQNQYKEAIKDIGLGYKEAALLPSDSDIILDEKESNEKVIRGRGQKAAEKLQIEKNEASYKQALPRQQRKLAREIEDTRAAIVSNLQKNGKSPFKNKKRRRSKGPTANSFGEKSHWESGVPELAISDSDSTDDSSHCEDESSNQPFSGDEGTCSSSEQVINVRRGTKPNVRNKKAAGHGKQLQDRHPKNSEGNVFLKRDYLYNAGKKIQEPKNPQHLRDSNIFLERDDVIENGDEMHKSIDSKQLKDDQIFLKRDYMNDVQTRETRNLKHLRDDHIFLERDDMIEAGDEMHEQINSKQLKDDQIFLKRDYANDTRQKTQETRNLRHLRDDHIFLERDDMIEAGDEMHEPINSKQLKDDQIFLKRDYGIDTRKKTQETRNLKHLRDDHIFLERDDMIEAGDEMHEPINSKQLKDDQIFLKRDYGIDTRKKTQETRNLKHLRDNQIFLERDDLIEAGDEMHEPIYSRQLKDDQIFLKRDYGKDTQKKAQETRNLKHLRDDHIFLERDDMIEAGDEMHEPIYSRQLKDDQIFLKRDYGKDTQKKAQETRNLKHLRDSQIFLEKADMIEADDEMHEPIDSKQLKDDQIFLKRDYMTEAQNEPQETRNLKHLRDSHIFLGRDDVIEADSEMHEPIHSKQLKDGEIFLTTGDLHGDQSRARHTFNSQAQQTRPSSLPIVSSEDKSVQTFQRESFKTRLDIPVDTRISDRIRSRATIPSGADPCDTFNDRVCTCDNFTRPPCYCERRVKKPTVVDRSTSYSDMAMKRPFEGTSGIHHRDKQHPTHDQVHKSYQPHHRQRQDISSGGLPFQDDIPPKPKVVLQPSKDNLHNRPPTQGKINYYDHDNRFSKDYIKDGSRVERITDEDLHISPGEGSDIQYYDKVFKRDKDAQVRGQKALEKERIQREYKELLKRLPALQRQERICEINNDKPEYHMSEERLLERERKRQNKMDNAYEKAFPQRKPAVVTIPRKTHEAKDVNLTPFKTCESMEGSPVLNLGEWDVEPNFPKGSNEKPSQSDKDTREQLMSMLEQLRNKKELLQTEIQKLPENNSPNELLGEFSNGNIENRELSEPPKNGQVKSRKVHKYREHRVPKENRYQECRKSDEDSHDESYEMEKSEGSAPRKVRPRERSKRRRSPVKPESLNASAESSNVDSHRSLSKEERYKKRHEKCFTSEPATSPTSPSPRKKAKIKKYKKRVLILQNCSTQTTPTEVKKVETVVSDKNIAKTGKKFTDGPRKKTSSQAEMPMSDLPHEEPAKLENICPKKHVPCDCIYSHQADYPEDFCQIVIKIKEDKKPEIKINPPERSKNVEIITEEFSTEHNTTDNISKDDVSQKRLDGKQHRKENKKKKAGVKEKVSVRSSPPPQEKYPKATLATNDDVKSKPTAEPKAKSWREQLGKNSSGETTTTSYYSPPDFAKIRAELAQAALDSDNAVKGSKLPPSCPFTYDQLLKKKPQQHNIDGSSVKVKSSDAVGVSQRAPREIDPKLFTYIKKLITMSKKNINELAVSTVSEVSTPSQSVIEMETNKPLNKLHNIMKYFNLNMADLQHHLSYSSNGSSAQFRTQENLTLSSSDGSQIHTQNLSLKNFTLSSRKASMEDSCGQNQMQKTSSSSTNRNLEKCADIAEKCIKRISDISDKLQQVRNEKMKILQTPPGSDPDQSTKYMQLPGLERSKEDDRSSRKSDSSESLDEELQKNLLKIDYSLAEKLKKMSPEELRQHEQNLYDQIDKEDDEKSNVSMSDSDRELFVRLQNLLQSSGKVVRDGQKQDLSFKQKSPSNDKIVGFTLSDPPNSTQVGSSKEVVDTNDVPFVPLLLDIPKLPKLTLNPLQPDVSDVHHRKPPLSKGLSIAKRYNGEIAEMVPHELSTIVEADSQLSTKVDQSPAPKSKLNTLHKIAEVNNQTEDKPGKTYGTVAQEKSPKSSSKSSDTEKSIEATEGKNTHASKLSESDQSLVDMLKELNKSLHTSSKSDTSKSGDLSKNTKPTSSSSDDKSDMEAVEKMLRSMGMEWAVTTMKKTKEALALSSSSSSIDLNIKASRTKSKSSKSSDISLREFLAQQMVAKISSSTLKSDASTPTNNLLGESQELSAIQFSMEKSQQRTSTPIPSSSKSMDKSKSPQKLVFSGESEISTVNNNSKEVKKDMTFYSLSETPSSNS